MKRVFGLGLNLSEEFYLLGYDAIYCGSDLSGLTLPKYAVAQLVEALCYKPEGRGFHSLWCYWYFSLT